MLIHLSLRADIPAFNLRILKCLERFMDCSRCFYLRGNRLRAMLRSKSLDAHPKHQDEAIKVYGGVRIAFLEGSNPQRSPQRRRE
jgi:hypothetical protein